MKFAAFIVLCVLGGINAVSAKSYDLSSEHLKVSVTDDWKVTTDSDELFGVTNANNDTFSITVNPVGKQLDIQHSTMLSNVKSELTSKGMDILKEGNLSFHGKDAITILTKITKLGFTIYTYEIIVSQGNDVLSFILVGDSDPSQQPQFQAILDTVAFTDPAPAGGSRPAASP